MNAQQNEQQDAQTAQVAPSGLLARLHALKTRGPVPPRVLYSLEGHDARLVEHDLRDIMDVIKAAVDACTPLLEHRPPLPNMYGKKRNMNRNVGFFADPEQSYGYFYSKQLSVAKPPPEAMQELLETINKRFNAQFNGALVNEYIDGSDYISDHSDDEHGLDPSIGVLAISWGAERIFRIKRKEVSGSAYDARTKPYHALLMAGADFQSKLTHGVPASKKVSGRRVSITFRMHNKALEEPLYQAWLKAQSKKRAREEE